MLHCNLLLKDRNIQPRLYELSNATSLKFCPKSADLNWVIYLYKGFQSKINNLEEKNLGQFWVPIFVINFFSVSWLMMNDTSITRLINFVTVTSCSSSFHLKFT